MPRVSFEGSKIRHWGRNPSGWADSIEARTNLRSNSDLSRTDRAITERGVDLWSRSATLYVRGSVLKSRKFRHLRHSSCRHREWILRRTRRYSLGIGMLCGLSARRQRVRFSCDASALYHTIRTPGIGARNVLAARNLSISVLSVFPGVFAGPAREVSKSVFAFRFARAAPVPKQLLLRVPVSGSTSHD